MTAQDALREAIAGERRHWHEVSVKPDDIAAVLEDLAELSGVVDGFHGLDADRLADAIYRAGLTVRDDEARTFLTDANAASAIVTEYMAEFTTLPQHLGGPGPKYPLPDHMRTQRTRQMSTREGYEEWKASQEPPCTQCGGGKGLGHTADCPAVATPTRRGKHGGFDDPMISNMANNDPKEPPKDSKVRRSRA